MKKSIVEMILEFIRQVRRNRRWQRAVTCVAALVVFVTTYALILPAITMEGNHPRLASEKLAGWAGDAMSVNVSAESPAGSGEKVVVLTAESVSAGLSEEYEFDAEGVAVIEDKMGQEIRLHRTVRENTEDTVDYWFVLAAGQKTEFSLDLQDEIVVDDVIASAGIVENVRTNKKEEAEKASASDAAKVEETEVAAVVTEATASNAAKKSAEKATASNTAKASASNADADEVETDDETGEIFDGAVINDLDVSDIDKETEVTATLKLNAGMGDELAEAIRDAEKNAEKRGNASLEFRWKMIVNTTQELEWSENGVTVHMYYDARAKIPEGAHLSVTEILEDDVSYQAYLDNAKAAVNSEAAKATASDAAGKYDVSHARFFDIKILDAEDGEIEPESQVVVKIDYDESVAIEEDASIKTVHFPNAGGTEVIDAVVDGGSTNLDGVAFNANSFSVYGVLSTSRITIEHLSHDGKKYEVTVTYGPEAKIPDGAKLSVSDIKEGTEEYEKARNAVLAAKEAKGTFIDPASLGLAALDISILDEQGNEIEPEASVQVDLKIKSLPGVEKLNDVLDSLEIQHHVETGDKVVVDTVYDGNSADAKFNVDANDKVIAEGTAIDPAEFEAKKTKELEKLDKIETSFKTEAFSTYTISWGSWSDYHSYDIHYVDTNGSSLTPTRTPEFSNGYKFLIYDVEGYEYDSTHYGSRTGTTIKPLLANYGNDRVYLDNNNSWQYLRNDIYVVYKKKATPTQGGTPKVDEDETWPTGNDAPQFGKSSKNNGNGTNTISLSIAGGEKPVSKSTPADVIVVFDRSGSMGDDMQGQARLARAKTAVNDMASKLLNGTNKNVRMALVSFSTTAQTVNITGATNGFTSNYTNYAAAVNGLSASGGTNWEQALQLANTLPVREDAATFVIFVTDGDPTFRVSRGNVSDSDLDLYSSNTYQYYRNNSIFGQGSADSEGLNFNFAVDQVSAINGANKSFYAIGISNDVTKVQNLTTQGGVDASHAFIASNTQAMDQAFKDITEAISSVLGFGNVKMTDGITALTNAEMKVMQSVDPNSFTYYRYGGENNKYGADYAHKQEWTTREADGCAAATYSEADGAVHWDMGATFQLEDDVTYVVEFTVWPSQDAYDLVADLNNGLKTYEGLTAKEKAQVVEVTAPTETTTGTYALKTNTDQVNATYNKTTESGGVVTVSDTTNIPATYHQGDLENMSLASDYIVVHKKWNNELDGRAGEGIDLNVTKDGAVYLDKVAVNKDNNWTSAKEYISAGVITKTTGGLYNVRESGHDYTVTEPANVSYYWDLTADIYRPMVIDGELHVLIKTDNPTGTEGTDYFRIPANSTNYYQVNEGTITLEASNDRRSVLDLKKIVTKDEGAADVPSPNETFTYTITVTDSGGADVWFSAQDSSGATMEIPNTSRNVVAEMKDGALTGYYYVPSGDSFTIDIKADWTVRFINLPTGSSYSIQETGKGEDNGFQFVNAFAAADNGGTPGTVEGGAKDTVTGSIDKPNNVFSATYTNKWLTKEVQIIKVDEKGQNLAGATFSLTRGHDAVTEFTSTADGGKTIALGKGTYCLTETAAPAGYIILSNKIYFNVNVDGTVALSNEEGATEGITYENATVSNPPDTTLGTVTISNNPGSELPHTGGRGTLPFRIAGFALMLMGAAYVSYDFKMRRRRERRLKK